MAVRKVEQELEILGGLREAPAEEALAGLRKALKDPINMMVAKAAALAAERQMGELLPDVLRAFERLFGDPVRRDPQCWGKNGAAKALVALGHTDAAPYLRGMRHIQMEPVWGGVSDTAGALRGTCILGLAACTDIRREDILRAMVDLAGDSNEPVRVEVVRGIAQMGGDEASLLLRMKARVGDEAVAVTGQVFDCLLALEGEEGVEFVTDFLKRGVIEVREEAALSLGTSRMASAVAVLREAWEQQQKEIGEVVLRALSLSRQEEAWDFLLELVRDGRKDAAEALAIHPELRERIEAAKGNAP
jgi:HEAT repeat protein